MDYFAYSGADWNTPPPSWLSIAQIDGSAIKSAFCSFKVPKFISRYLCQEAHKFQGIRYPLWPILAPTHLCVHTHTH